MFGSTVLVPILTGLDPAMALLCAGLGTLIFHLVTGGKVPAFLGSSFAFIAAICTVAADASGNAALGSAEYMEGLRYAGGEMCIRDSYGADIRCGKVCGAYTQVGRRHGLFVFAFAAGGRGGAFDGRRSIGADKLYEGVQIRD